MRIGIRKPSIKKSIKARTTGKLKRTAKKTAIPGYGKKGIGWIKKPKKAAYNKIYNKTSVGLFPSTLGFSVSSKKKRTTNKKETTVDEGLANSRPDEIKIISSHEESESIMKICKFCGQTNDDDAKVCSSCAGIEFSYKCSNCGNVFDNGNYCPRCGIKIGTKAKTCPSCGNEYYTNACPNCGFSDSGSNPEFFYLNNTTEQPKKKRKTWLWVLGWLFIFPLPLTVLLLRKKDMKPVLKYGIIAAAWIVFLIIGFAAGGSKSENTPGEKTNEGTDNREIVFTYSAKEEITLKVGEKYSSGYLKVDVNNASDFSLDDVNFVTDDPKVATISLTRVEQTTDLYYEIIAVGLGETYVYATSKDGNVISEKIKVTVSEPILADKITIKCAVKELVLGESLALAAIIEPDNADDKTVIWSSSDTSVVEVDDKGKATAVGGGTAAITAMAKNGESDSIELHVDGSKRTLSLIVTRSRHDTNNIGDDWRYVTQVNGESYQNTYILAVGDKLEFYAQFTEADKKPDVGEASSSYTVTEADLLNGFSVVLDLLVTENAGLNSGQSAHFTITFEFKP